MTPPSPPPPSPAQSARRGPKRGLGRGALLPALGLVLACHSAPLAPLGIDAVAPGTVAGVVDTAVVLTGRFPPAVTLELDAPEQSTAQTGFQVQLVAGTAPTALSGRWISQAQLVAVVPAGTAPGTYAVRVTDPEGRTAELPAALVVWPGCLDASSCDDGRSCTVDSCDGSSVCQHTLSPGSCFIDQACWTDGQEDPAAPCTGCVAAVSTSTRTAFADGAACSDGDGCTQGETCKNGKCRAPTSHTNCPATQCATGGSCDPATGACLGSAVNEGLACDDGSACTTSDSCQAGVCRGTSVCLESSPAPAGPEGSRAPLAPRESP